jgi:hypothetical protein
MQLRTKLMLGLGIAALLLIVARLLIGIATPQTVDPRTRIQQIITEGKQAFEREDVDGMIEYLAEEFTWSGMDKQRLRYQLLQFFRNAHAPRAELGELQIEMFAGSIVVRTPIRITWRDPNSPNALNSQDFGVVEFEFRKLPQRKWWVIQYEDWRLVRMESTQTGEIPL